MSGGSLDYLYAKDELVSQAWALTTARDFLRAHGFESAALRLDEMLALVDSLTAIHGELRDVLHAVEWWMSGDSGRDDLEQAVAEWTKARAEKGAKP